MATNAPDTDPQALATPSDLGDNGRQAIADSVNKLVADAFVLYAKTKNFHWHMAGPHYELSGRRCSGWSCDGPPSHLASQGCHFLGP